MSSLENTSGNDRVRPADDDVLDLVVPSRASVYDPAATAGHALPASVNGAAVSHLPKMGTALHGSPTPLSPEGEHLPEPREQTETTSEGWFGLFMREMVETVVLAVVIFLVIRVGVQNYRIEGQSMEPNFHNGEYLLVNKLAYRLGDFNRGDVIVFHYPNDPSKDYIKRVIGLPGDTVEIRAGTLYVNEIAVEEPYDHMPMVRDAPPTVVAPGHLYVLGDNRPASADTRSWGLLSQDLVIGRAWLAIYPLDQFGLVAHPTLDLNSVMAQGP